MYTCWSCLLREKPAHLSCQAVFKLFSTKVFDENVSSYLICPSHSSWLDHQRNILRRIQIAEPPLRNVRYCPVTSSLSLYLSLSVWDTNVIRSTLPKFPQPMIFPSNRATVWVGTASHHRGPASTSRQSMKDTRRTHRPYSPPSSHSPYVRYPFIFHPRNG